MIINKVSISINLVSYILLNAGTTSSFIPPFPHIFKQITTPLTVINSEKLRTHFQTKQVLTALM